MKEQVVNISAIVKNTFPSILAFFFLLLAVNGYSDSHKSGENHPGSAITGEPDLEAGARLWAHCAFCHGVEGFGWAEHGVPKIAGQEAWYTERQLKNYISRARGGDPRDMAARQMMVYTAPLVDEQSIRNVAAYIEQLPVTLENTKQEEVGSLYLDDGTPVRPWYTDDLIAPLSGDPEAGKAVYAGCIACHGDSAQGNPAMNAPRLDNKLEQYLVRQLVLFRKGVKGYHETDIYGQQMSAAAKSLLPDDQAIHDVVAYIRTFSKGLFNPTVQRYDLSMVAGAIHSEERDISKLVEIRLDHPSEPRGWCVDVMGWKKILVKAGGAHAHTCYSSRDDIDFWYDQEFDVELAKKGKLYLPGMNICLEMANNKPGAFLGAKACDDISSQRFSVNGDGSITSADHPELCLTLASDWALGFGGPDPSTTKMTQLYMDTCREDGKFQRWSFNRLSSN